MQNTPSELNRLEVAIARSDLADVAFLLKQTPALLDTPFPENIGLTPLMWACRNRRESIVRELLSRGASVHATNTREADGDGGNTALWFTAQGQQNGTTGSADMLLNHGAHIDTRGEHGTTAFFMAVSWCHLDLVQLLLSRGANPVVPNNAGETPLNKARATLEWCARQTHLEPSAQYFLERAPRIIAFLERSTSSQFARSPPFV